MYGFCMYSPPYTDSVHGLPFRKSKLPWTSFTSDLHMKIGTISRSVPGLSYMNSLEVKIDQFLHQDVASSAEVLFASRALYYVAWV